jgi:outer membrane protein TolC
VRANARAAEVARKSYAQGLTDFLTVLVAEQSLFTSQDTLAQSQRDVSLDLVALYKAVGGGWETSGAVREDVAMPAVTRRRRTAVRRAWRCRAAS